MIKILQGELYGGNIWGMLGVWAIFSLVPKPPCHINMN